MKTRLSSAEAKVVLEELIGKNIKIINSPQQELIGTEGKIIDETMKMIVIQTSKKELKIKKEHNEFEIEGNKIKGDKLKFRPHERIKKYWRKIHGKMHR